MRRNMMASVKSACLVFLGIFVLQNMLSANHFTKSPKKIALLVGISEYSKAYKSYMRWSATSAFNDIKYFKSVLARQGYSEFIILENSVATRENILFALNDSLPSRVEEGDIVHFHFSGHGQRMFDDNADEIDGLDESIVPYDAAKLYIKNKYEGENHIRDDELRSSIDYIRKKLGDTGHMTVTIDACYSGTGLRSHVVSKARGTELILESTEYSQSRKDVIHLEKGFEGFSTSKDLSPMVAFFGSSMDELNYECHSDLHEEMGSLSYAFCKAIAKSEPDQTFEYLFDEILHIMSYKAPFQHPEAEGSLETKIGGGISNTSHLENDVVNLKEVDSILVVELGKGLIDGYIEGAKVKMTTGSADGILFHGFIKQADLVECDVVFKGWYDSLNIKKEDIQIELIERRFNRAKNIFAAADLLKYIQNDTSLTQYFKKYVFVDANHKSDLVLTFDSINEKVILSHLTGLAMDTVSIYECTKSISKFFRADFFRGLTCRRNGISAEVSLRLYNEKWKVNNKKKFNLKIGDKYKLHVKNIGSQPFYFTLIYIDNANSIHIDIPLCDEYNNCSHTPKEMKLDPNESRTFFQVFTIDYPLGIDIIKLIASPEPVDLRSLSNDRSNVILNESSIEYLYNQFNNNRELDDNPYFSLLNNAYTIETVILEISK